MTSIRQYGSNKFFVWILWKREVMANTAFFQKKLLLILLSKITVDKDYQALSSFAVSSASLDTTTKEYFP